ncbi:MAG: DUF4099 domain-containing protein [Microscillaceae bacterium]|jgi:hypothetical protein|nr:DUF4099 domain-containing protein [Microscillaceae bacterium]
MAYIDLSFPKRLFTYFYRTYDLGIEKRNIEAIKTMLQGRISNLLPITLSFGEGRVRQKKCVNLKCALLQNNLTVEPIAKHLNLSSDFVKKVAQKIK